MKLFQGKKVWVIGGSCARGFRHAAAIDAAFESAATSAVMANVIRFTDLSPARLRAVSL